MTHTNVREISTSELRAQTAVAEEATLRLDSPPDVIDWNVYEKMLDELTRRSREENTQ